MFSRGRHAGVGFVFEVGLGATLCCSLSTAASCCYSRYSFCYPFHAACWKNMYHIAMLAAKCALSRLPSNPATLLGRRARAQRSFCSRPGVPKSSPELPKAPSAAAEPPPKGGRREREPPQSWAVGPEGVKGKASHCREEARGVVWRSGKRGCGG